MMTMIASNNQRDGLHANIEIYMEHIYIIYLTLDKQFVVETLTVRLNRQQCTYFIHLKH